MFLTLNHICPNKLGFVGKASVEAPSQHSFIIFPGVQIKVFSKLFFYGC